MKLRARPISLEVGEKPVIILNKEDSESLGLHALERAKIRSRGKELIAIVDVTTKFAEPGEVITNDQVTSFFSLKLGDQIDIEHTETPESVIYIKQKISGSRLEAEKMKTIVKDVVAKRLSDLELTAFVTALDIHGMSMDEVEALSRAMVETGKTLNIPGKTIVDKHSCGGVPGDKTSLLAVPIIAAAGLTIPKTSSRAITSPAGTADRFEVLAPVDLKIEDIERVVRKTNGCIVWGGALELSPADDIFIQIEYPLGIDPLLLPSILSKKKAVGAKYVVIDIPTGRGTKVKTIGEAHELSEDFIELGKRLGIQISCAITYGEQPIGYAMGPALEAREALLTLQGKGPKDLVDKATEIVGMLFDMVGINKGNGKAIATKLLGSGKAEKKLREIIEAQGGDPKIKPSDIELGDKVEIKSEKEGKVLWVKNAELAAIAREAGAPKDRGSGILLSKKLGQRVKKGDVLFTIYSNNKSHMNNALKLVEDYQPFIVGKDIAEKMLLAKMPTKVPHRRLFMLER